jgi:hypothetical protein
MVDQLNASLPPEYEAEPRVHLGSESEALFPSEYEVLVYDVTLGRRLVAAVEIVSPANKDRSENRRSFVYKCESLCATVCALQLWTLLRFGRPTFTASWLS